MKNFKFKAHFAIVCFCLLASFNLSAQGATPVAAKPATPTVIDSTKKVVSAPDSSSKKASSNFFVGKWDVLVFGLPQGDTHMPMVFEMKLDSATQKEKMVGRIDAKGTGVIPFSKVEPADTSITFYFTAQGYDLNMTLDKKDADNATGRMFDMFDAKAVRIKE